MEMKRSISILAFIALASAGLAGQSFKAYLKAGDEALQRKDYNAAFQHFGNALEYQPDDPAVLYRYAEAARHFYAYELAEKHYQQVLASKQGEQYPLAAFHLASIYRSQGEYDKAKAYYQMYLAHPQSAPPQQERAQLGIQACEWARGMAGKEAPLRVENLGRRVNTEYSEFAPLLRGDTLFYSSLRFERSQDDYRPARKIAQVLYQKGSSRGRPLGGGFNDGQLHTAHTAFSLDGRRLYFTRCDYVNASEIRCALYYYAKDRRGRWGGKATRLPEAINLPGFTATQPAIGYDSVQQAELLFFVSDRPEGKGGLDIWHARVGEGENRFDSLAPLATLNTPADELTPFYHTPSQSLYFSSDGYLGFGGYDVFSAARQGRGWSQPQNLGAPVNTSYNDIYYVLDDNGASGYLSSNRPGAFFLDADNKACCNDLYRFEPLPPPPTPTDEPATPALVETPPLPAPPAAPAIPTTLEGFLPLSLYFDNDEPDRRTRRETTRKAYLEAYERYYARQTEYLDAFAAGLAEERREEAEAAVETFFAYELRKGQEFLLRFSEILLRKLQAGDEVEIFIKGYTSPRAQSDYNLALSKRRISSVRNHFLAYQGGVFLPYLEAGTLKVTERPFGDTQASKTVSAALDDLRNSIYHPDAARERRVEIVEVK
jgi:tetratricopeptide (TPR) repeat protein